MGLLSLGVIWVACGVLAYGITLGFFDTRYGDIAYGKERANQRTAVAVGLSGPCGLLVSLIGSGFVQHGFRWKAITREEARERHRKAFPALHDHVMREVEGE